MGGVSIGKGVSAKDLDLGTPNPLVLTLGTAYQATDPTRPALVTVSLQSTSTVSLAGASNNEGGIWIGSDASVAFGGGTQLGTYKNTLGGTIVVGLNLSTTSANSYEFALPRGWYYAIRQTVGTGLSIPAAFDQAVG